MYILQNSFVMKAILVMKQDKNTFKKMQHIQQTILNELPSYKSNQVLYILYPIDFFSEKEIWCNYLKVNEKNIKFYLL